MLTQSRSDEGDGTDDCDAAVDDENRNVDHEDVDNSCIKRHVEHDDDEMQHLETFLGKCLGTFIPTRAFIYSSICSIHVSLSGP